MCADNSHRPESILQILVRPSGQLDQFSPEDRWEVTRRHPYYQLLWETAGADPADDGAQQLMQKCARIILQSIGVASVYPRPSTPWAELNGDDIASAWGSGAISRVTVRSVVAMLAGGAITSEAKRLIADILLRSTELDPNNSAQSYRFVEEITQEHPQHLNLMLPELIIRLNPELPQRAVTRAVEDFLRQHKTERQIPEHRRRDDKLADYLRVWDLREGWTGAEYDNRKELSLKEVAQLLKLSTSTVMNRYRSAFRSIFGHEYSSGRWLQAMGVLKLSKFGGGEQSRVAARRPMNDSHRRDVPESVISPGSHVDQPGMLQVAGVRSSDIETVELADDIRTLIDAGRENDEIISELGLQSELASDLIEALRHRGTEGL